MQKQTPPLHVSSSQEFHGVPRQPQEAECLLLLFLVHFSVLRQFSQCCPSLFEPVSMFVFMSLCSFLHFLLCFPSASQKDMGLYSWRLLYPSQRGQKGNSAVLLLRAVCMLWPDQCVCVVGCFAFNKSPTPPLPCFFFFFGKNLIITFHFWLGDKTV